MLSTGRCPSQSSRSPSSKISTLRHHRGRRSGQTRLTPAPAVAPHPVLESAELLDPDRPARVHAPRGFGSGKGPARDPAVCSSSVGGLVTPPSSPFNPRPLSRASRPFVGPILKGGKGSNGRVRQAVRERPLFAQSRHLLDGRTVKRIATLAVRVTTTTR
jgi:hypothetical protein